MKPGRAITYALREQRLRDIKMLANECIRSGGKFDYYVFLAWVMWGWNISAHDACLGMPGVKYPRWD